MEENNNKIVEDHEKAEEYKYNFNFINIPWDDRTRTSKIGIVALLITIAVATIGCVINNLITHYKSFYKNIPLAHETKCHLIKIETTPFVARIYLISTMELLCLGAVIGSSSVIANDLCAKSGPIRIGVGSAIKPQCKKGFAVDIIDTIIHEGAILNNIVLLTTMEKMSACSSPIKIAAEVDFEANALIYGRPMMVTRGLKSLLTRQPAIIIGVEETKNISAASVKSMKSNMICVRELANCPVGAGDLLIQDDKVLGVSLTSVQSNQSRTACFANLNMIRLQLMEFMTETIYD